MKVSVLKLFLFLFFFYPLKGMDYRTQDKALVSTGINQPTNFNAIKIMRIFQRNLKDPQQKIFLLFDPLSLPLKMKIFTDIFQKISSSILEVEITFWKELVMMLSARIENISVIHQLFEMAKKEKYRVMDALLKKNHASPQPSKLKTLNGQKFLAKEPSYQALQFLGIHFLTIIRDALTCDFKFVVNLKYSLVQLFNKIVSPNPEVLPPLRNLSIADRHSLTLYFFGTYLTKNYPLMHSPGRINTILSLTYDNQPKKFISLEYKGWRKRARELSYILSLFKQTSPVALELSQGPIDPIYTDPQVRSLYCLNYHISRCLTATILININTLKAKEAHRDLVFLFLGLGNQFFCEAIQTILKTLHNLIKETDNKLKQNRNAILKIIACFKKAMGFLMSPTINAQELYADISKECDLMIIEVTSKEKEFAKKINSCAHA